MASLSELVDYAKAKQPRNGLAEIAAHFIQGASSGYDAGREAQLKKVDQILKTAQAEEAQQKTLELKIRNEMWTGLMDQAKGQGDMPLTAGEMMNGRVVTSKNIGVDANTSKSTFDLPKLFQRFMPKGQDSQVTAHMKTPFGELVVGPKPKVTESSKTATDREDRLLRESAFKSALAMTQAEDPLAATPNPKYLRLAYENLGKNPDDYIPRKKLTVPAHNDPFGLLGQGGQ